MKKSRLLVLAAASVALCAAAVGCGDKHEHEYGSWDLTTKPTLTTEGSATRTCTANDDGVETVVVPNLSNKDVWTVSSHSDATHTAAGKTVYTSEYGTVEISIAQGKHEWGAWEFTQKPTTLTESGEVKRVCNSEDGGEEVETIRLTDSEIWKKDANKSTPASHIADGEDVYVSSKYGLEVSITVPKDTNHQWDNWEIVEKPELNKAGTVKGYCNINGCTETKTEPIAMLSDTEVWKKDANKSTPASHIADGEDVYVSEQYGLDVSITVLKDTNHQWDNWEIVEKPELNKAGTVKGYCNINGCTETKTEPIAMLSDTEVWKKDAKKSTPATHTDDGEDVYVSEQYGLEVSITILKDTNHQWGDWKFGVEPQLNTPGTWVGSCIVHGCTETTSEPVPMLSDDTVWAKETIDADYNHAGKTVYTSQKYGTVEIPGAAKLVAPYDGKTYIAVEVYITEQGTTTTYGWTSAQMTLDEKGEGAGTAHPYQNETWKVSMVDAAKGKISIATHSVNSDGQDIDKTYTAYVDMTTGVIVRPIDASWSGIYVFLPYGWEDGKSKVEAVSLNGSFAITYSKEDVTENYFVSDDKVVFGATFASDKAGTNKVTVADVKGKTPALVYVIKGDVIASYAKDAENAYVPADGYEGTYTLTETVGTTKKEYEVVVSGSGMIAIMTEGDPLVGTYTIAEGGAAYTASAIVEGTYYEAVLNGDFTGTLVTPMVTVTFNLNGIGELVKESDKFNKNVVATFTDPEDTNAKKFDGWYFDAACTDAVPTDFKPTEDVTIYAKWSNKFVVHAVVKDGDTRDIYYGVGNVIGSRLPNLTTDPETGLTYVDPETNCVFVGWYTDPSFASNSALDERATIEEEDGDSITIYAKWEPAGTWSIEQGSSYQFVYDSEKGAWKSNNQAINNSNAIMQIVAIGDIYVTFDFKTSSEGSDKLTIRKYEVRNGNNSVIKTIGGTTNDWETYSVALTDGQLITLTYNKDGSVHTGDDTAYIRGLKINGRAVTLSGTVDFAEGTYTCAGKDNLELNGYGAFTWGEKEGTYSATNTENVFDMYVVADGKKTESYTITLDGNTYTVVENTVTVSYNFGDLSASLNSATPFNDVAFTLPTAPEVSGYIFRGWFDNVACEGTAITAITPTGDTTIYAKYDAAVTVTLIHNHGISDETITNKFVNDTLTLEDREDTATLVFRGWYDNEDFEGDAITEIVLEGDVEIYAKWEAKVVVTVYLNYDDAPTVDPIAYASGETTNITVPTRDANRFMGWYTTAACTEDTKWTDGQAITANVDIYAKWGDPVPMYGTYKGWNFWGMDKDTSAGTKLASQLSTTVLASTAGGAITGKSSGQLTDEQATITNGSFVLGGTRYYYFNKEAGIIWTANSATAAGINASVLNDTDIGFDMARIKSVDFYGRNDFKINDVSKYIGWLKLTYLDDSTMNVFCYNDTVYDNVTWTDNIAVSELKNANEIEVKDKNAQTIVVLVKSGSSFIVADDYRKTYTNTADETLFLNGGAMVTYGDKTGTYTAVEGKEYTFDVDFGEERWWLTVDKTAGTFSIEKPMATIAFNMNEHGEAISPIQQNVAKTFSFASLTFETTDGELTFIGWYDNEDCEGDAITSFTPTEKNKTYTFYAKWQEAVAYFGSYSGAEVWGKKTGGGTTSYSTNDKTLTVAADGQATGSQVGTTETVFDETNSIIKFGNYFGVVDLENGVIVYNYSSGGNEVKDDIYVLIRGQVKAKTATSMGCEWDNGLTRLLAFTLDDNSVMNIFVYNNRVYGNVTFTSTDGGVTVADAYSKKQLTVKDSKGNAIASFVKGNNGLQLPDEFAGPYTNAENASGDQIILDGGCIITYGDKVGTYVAVPNQTATFDITFEGVTGKIITLVLDMANRTFTLTEEIPDYDYTISLQKDSQKAWVEKTVSGESVYSSGNKGSDNSTSTMIVNILKAGKITFQWKVSSEESYDYFDVVHVSTGGSTTILSRKSGSTSYATCEITVQAGDTIEFSYTKDSQDASGDDQAYVKNIVFTTAE